MEARMSRTTEPPDLGAYDALTDLFLGGPADSGSPADADANPPSIKAAANSGSMPRPAFPVRIEGLVLGHLPILASAWVNQYARHTAAQLRAPVVLVKLRAGECSLELFGTPEAEAMRRAPALGPAASMEDAVAMAAGRAGLWLIRVDDIAEPHLAELDSLDTVTLLTGAHESAVVASYRTIKQLFRPASEEEGEGPEVRLAIMGAAVDRAADATQKLERAAETFLGRRVGVSACIAKIGPGRSTLLYRGPLVQDAAAVLNWLIPAIRSPRPAAAAQTTASPREGRAAITPAPSMAAHSGAAVPAAAASPRVAAPAAAEASLPASAPLAAHVPGLNPIAAACPYTPAVQLATDADGRLHLLAHTRGPVDPAAPAVAQLLTAAAWARAHWALLRLTPGQELGEAVEPVLHMLTPDARAVRALGESSIRLHLLAPVQAGGTVVWFCTELN